MTFREKLEEIIMNRTCYDYLNMPTDQEKWLKDTAVDQIISLFEEEHLKLIGEDEELAEWKPLVLESMHDRWILGKNALRQELRDKVRSRV
jgi:hypothetical protein